MAGSVSSRLFVMGAKRALGGYVSVEMGRHMGTVADNRDLFKVDLFKAIKPVVRQLDMLTKVDPTELSRLDAVFDGAVDSLGLQAIVQDSSRLVGDSLTEGMSDRVVTASSTESCGGEIRINPSESFHKTIRDILVTAQHEALHEVLSDSDRLAFN